MRIRIKPPNIKYFVLFIFGVGIYYGAVLVHYMDEILNGKKEEGRAEGYYEAAAAFAASHIDDSTKSETIEEEQQS